MAARRGRKKRTVEPRDDERGAGGTPVEAGPDDWRAIASNPEVARAIRGHFEYKEAKSTQRGKINADIASSRRGLEGRSLNGPALKAMESYYQMDAGKRAGWIQSVLIIMQAMGDPLQADMLTGLLADDDSVVEGVRQAINGSPKADPGAEPDDKGAAPPEKPGAPAPGLGGTVARH